MLFLHETESHEPNQINSNEKKRKKKKINIICGQKFNSVWIVQNKNGTQIPSKSNILDAYIEGSCSTQIKKYWHFRLHLGTQSNCCCWFFLFVFCWPKKTRNVCVKAIKGINESKAECQYLWIDKTNIFTTICWISEFFRVLHSILIFDYFVIIFFFALVFVELQRSSLVAIPYFHLSFHFFFFFFSFIFNKLVSDIYDFLLYFVFQLVFNSIGLRVNNKIWLLSFFVLVIISNKIYLIYWQYSRNRENHEIVFQSLNGKTNKSYKQMFIRKSCSV